MMMILMYASFMSVWLHAGTPSETGAKKRKTETKISKQGKIKKHDYDLITSFTGEEGWLSGESACITPMWPEFDSDQVP